MARLIFDYRCETCAWDGELVVSTPAPPTEDCPVCGGRARRRYTIAGLAGVGRGLSGTAPASGSVDCRQNPDVAGLCHVAPSARRALVARHRGDETTYHQERVRQQREFETHGPPPLDKVFTHTHPQKKTSPS